MLCAMPVWRLGHVSSIVLLAALTLLCLGDLAHAGMSVGPAAAGCGTEMLCSDETLCSATTPPSSAPAPVAVLQEIPGPAAPTITQRRPLPPSPDLPDRPPLLAAGSRSPPLA